ncbi:hypothetical protein HDC92_000680 [Pedobacter sp. AK017]|uniref:hypothetical protein n=1 Tax=Pedobacter sp. AK017 TaxID=2723073 RepID=UPI0016148958|nr:hypothetical protein [Pedobacter sp. AK017]MBB5437012.1 hypothetical protein [Pedobacter sp. AK017]
MNIKRSIGKRLHKVFGRKKKDQPVGPLTNLYQTNYDRTVLISYLTTPFYKANDFTHQNYLTSHIVAESFSALGYNVDVVDYSDSSELNYDKYAVIFGMGKRMEQSFYEQNRHIPRVYFVTGAHDDLHNRMGLKSIKDFYALSGLWLPEETNILTDCSYYTVFNADFAIIFARGYIYEDYKSRFEQEIFSLNNNILNVFSDCKPKSAAGRSSGFLYLSGGKQLTKGLPLFLEVARLHKDLKFYVVVPDLNQALEDYYKDVFAPEGNVSLFKNLRMDGKEMKAIVEACSYVVAPSYIDGLPGGMIEPMSAGLVPIVSRYCGFPKQDFIFEMETLSVAGLQEMFARVLAMDDEAYINCSNAVKAYTQKNFSAAQVKEELIEILKAKLS